MPKGLGNHSLFLFYSFGHLLLVPLSTFNRYYFHLHAGVVHAIRFLIQSTLDLSNSDISNSGKLEAST